MENLATEFETVLIGHRFDALVQSTIPSVSFPIISKGDTWVRVNDIVIDEYNGEFRVKRKGVLLAIFLKKIWAVSYAISYSQGEYEICAKLARLNFQLTKSSEEINRYTHQLEIAQDTRNIIKENILSDRLSRTIAEYDAIVKEANQIIKYPQLG